MAPRARGANAQMALAFAAAYGGIPASGSYFKLPFATEDLGEEQGLVESDLLGYGRDPQQPGQDVISNVGQLMVPVDLRGFGYWLKLLLGQPTTTQGVAASGSVAFTAQPANASTVTVNGTAFAFKTSPATATDVKIGATLADSVTNLVVALNASADVNVSPATYGADLNLTTLTVTHDTIGTGGNSFTLATTVTGATASGATLAGGATSGPYNHVFVSGSASLPDAAIEVGLTDVPSYAMNFGVMINTLGIALQRSGHLNAQLGYIAQGENPRVGASVVGALAELVIERFAQASGQILRDGAPLGEIVSGQFSFSNGLDPVEVIRPDGRIAGVDPGIMAATGTIVSRFSNTTLLDLATNRTPVELVKRWSLGAGKSLTLKVHQVYLPRVKVPVSGPGGIQASFPYQGAEHPTLHRTLTATLVNDVASY